MESIVLFLLSNPAIRTLIKDIVVEAFAELIHKRSVDPTYKAASDQAFSEWGAAKTPEEKLYAAKSLSALLSR